MPQGADSPYGWTPDEAALRMRELGAEAFRGRQALEWVYKKHIRQWKQARTLPEALQTQLEKSAPLRTLSFASGQDSRVRDSQKYLFRTYDGRLLESVLITQQGRRTVCVSTQLGCKVGCTFCASGKGRFGRNLSAAEVIEQIIWIEETIAQPVTNIVFMGMGEPFDNFEVTMRALEIMQAEWGLALAGRRITVSTSGITPRILEFVERTGGRVRLSVSLHAVDQKKRSELVPINRRYTLEELIRTLEKVHRDLKKEITFEYTILDGVNNTPEDIRRLARLSNRLNAKVNLIPYNPIREMDYKRPSAESVRSFRRRLIESGVKKVTVRQTAGRDIDAACGQLRLDREASL